MYAFTSVKGEGLHCQGSEGMPKVVKAEPWQAGLAERLMETPAEPPVVKMATHVVNEHEVGIAREPRPPAQAIERSRSLIDQRDRPDPT